MSRWTCLHCTFINTEPFGSTCDVCERERDTESGFEGGWQEAAPRGKKVQVQGHLAPRQIVPAKVLIQSHLHNSVTGRRPKQPEDEGPCDSDEHIPDAQFGTSRRSSDDVLEYSEGSVANMQPRSQNEAKIACPACTYENNYDLSFCEICESALPSVGGGSSSPVRRVERDKSGGLTENEGWEKQRVRGKTTDRAVLLQQPPKSGGRTLPPAIHRTGGKQTSGEESNGESPSPEWSTVVRVKKVHVDLDYDASQSIEDPEEEAAGTASSEDPQWTAANKNRPKQHSSNGWIRAPAILASPKVPQGKPPESVVNPPVPAPLATSESDDNPRFKHNSYLGRTAGTAGLVTSPIARGKKVSGTGMSSDVSMEEGLGPVPPQKLAPKWGSLRAGLNPIVGKASSEPVINPSFYAPVESTPASVGSVQPSVLLPVPGTRPQIWGSQWNVPDVELSEWELESQECGKYLNVSASQSRHPSESEEDARWKLHDVPNWTQPASPAMKDLQVGMATSEPMGIAAELAAMPVPPMQQSPFGDFSMPPPGGMVSTPGGFDVVGNRDSGMGMGMGIPPPPMGIDLMQFGLPSWAPQGPMFPQSPAQMFMQQPVISAPGRQLFDLLFRLNCYRVLMVNTGPGPTEDAANALCDTLVHRMGYSTDSANLTSRVILRFNSEQEFANLLDGLLTMRIPDRGCRVELSTPHCPPSYWVMNPMGIKFPFDCLSVADKDVANLTRLVS